MVERRTDHRLYGSSDNGHGVEVQGSVVYRSSGRESETTITASMDSLISTGGIRTDERLYGTGIRREPTTKWRWQLV